MYAIMHIYIFFSKSLNAYKELLFKHIRETLRIPWTKRVSNEEFITKMTTERTHNRNHRESAEIHWTHNVEGGLEKRNPRMA